MCKRRDGSAICNTVAMKVHCKRSGVVVRRYGVLQYCRTVGCKLGIAVVELWRSRSLPQTCRYGDMEAKNPRVLESRYKHSHKEV